MLGTRWLLYHTTLRRPISPTPRYSVVLPIAVMVALIFVPSTLRLGWGERPWTHSGLIDDIRLAVQPSERVFMEDLSGKLALLSQRSFVSGDGLVNSFEYLENYLKPGRVGDYLLDKQIQYFLTSNVPCSDDRPKRPWTRHLVLLERNGLKYYEIMVDIGYLTNLDIKPSRLHFPVENIVFDRCVGGVREVLFRVPQN